VSPEAEAAPKGLRRLGETLDGLDAVVAVDVYYHDRGGDWRVEAVLSRSRDAVPSPVLAEIADVGLGVRDVTPRATYGDLRVVVE
jgi:hypothetical protein